MRDLSWIHIICCLLSFMLVAFLGATTSDFSIFISWLIGTIPFFFLKKKTNKNLFLFSYCINTIIAVIICLENYYTIGFLHTTNLDDKDFYQITLNLVDKDLSVYGDQPRLSVFFFVTTKIYQLLELISISSKSYFHFLCYNLVLGSLVPVIVYIFGNTISANKATMLKGAYLTSIFPTIVFFNAIGLRDAWITFFFTLCITLYLRDTNNLKDSVKKYAYLLISIVCIYFLRSQSIFYPILFITICEFLKNKKFKNRLTILLFTGLVSIVFLFFYFETVKDSYLWYKTFQYFVNSENSLGLRLKYESGLFGKIIYSIYYIIGPFPFLSFSNLTFANLFLDVGIVLAGIIIPFYIYLSIKNFVDPLRLSYILTFIITSIILAQITGHLRQKTVFYPLMLMIFYLDYKKISVAIKKKFFLISSFGYLIIISIYIAIKSRWI